MKSIKMCHDKNTWKANGVTYFRSWCGHETFDDGTPLTDKEANRILSQTRKDVERPRVHCEKCIKAKTAANPGYIPPDINSMNAFDEPK
jgi:hypothetical protein